MSRARPAKLAAADLRRRGRRRRPRWVVFLTLSGEETSDEAAAPKTPDGCPVENALRKLWVTATALATALNMQNLSVLVIFARPQEAGAS